MASCQTKTCWSRDAICQTRYENQPLIKQDIFLVGNLKERKTEADHKTLGIVTLIQIKLATPSTNLRSLHETEQRGNSNGGYPRNGDSFWPVTGPSAHCHRYELAQVPTLGLRSIKAAITGRTKFTGGTWNCP